MTNLSSLTDLRESMAILNARMAAIQSHLATGSYKNKKERRLAKDRLAYLREKRDQAAVLAVSLQK